MDEVRTRTWKSKDEAPEDAQDRRAAAIFDAFLQRPGAESLSLFDDLCAEHPELEPRLRKRWQDWREVEGLFGEVRRQFGDLPEGSFGDYDIRERLGVGGMGVVYLADQKRPVRRRVAIKLVKEGMDTHEILTRFQAERQALARMGHPCVAQVFDAGATHDGRPYFVMEYVEGEPIQDFVDREGLSLSERLELFVDVCQAIQHAHQKGLIHRDIKPSNVLAFRGDDGRPRCKVIDFGVAKAFGESLTDQTLETHQGCLLGTPSYMSPEQTGVGGDVDTRTDIFALGVLLYELLTDTRPFEGDASTPSRFHELVTLIRDVDPPPPSQRALGGESSFAPRDLRGDLDWITMKAMSKERDRRYASAAELAADVVRSLRHEPVVAGPPSAFYRLRRLARRHRALFIGSMAVALSLIAGLAVSTALYYEMKQERNAAIVAQNEAAERLEDVRTLTRTIVFDLHERLARTPGTAETRQFIYRHAVSYLDEMREAANDDPTLMWELATAYTRVADILGELGNTHRGDFQGAREAALKADELLEILARRSPDDMTLRLDYTANLVRLGDSEGYRGQPAEARHYYGRALEAVSDLEPTMSGVRDAIMVVEERLGDMDRDAGRGAQALEHYRRFEELSRVSHRPRDAYLSHLKLGGVLESMGRLDEACVHYEALMDVLDRMNASNTEDAVTWTRDRLSAFAKQGHVASLRGDFETSRDWYHRAYEVTADLAVQDPGNLAITHDVAVAHARMGLAHSRLAEHDTATREMERGLSVLEELLATNDGNSAWQKSFANMLLDCSVLLRAAGREEEAEKRWEEACGVALDWADAHPEDVWPRALLAKEGRLSSD